MRNAGLRDGRDHRRRLRRRRSTFVEHQPVRAMIRVALLLTALAPCACGGGSMSSGSLLPADHVGQGPAAARMHAALDALTLEMGHPVEVRIDRALIERDGAPALADAVGTIARDVHRTFREAPAYTFGKDVLLGAVGLPALATVRAIEFRYAVVGDSRRDFDPRTGIVRFTSCAQCWLMIDEGEVFENVVHDWLAPRFDGRDAATIAPGDLDAFVLHLLPIPSPIPNTASVPDPRAVDELPVVYPRLSGPTRTTAEHYLLGMGDGGERSLPSARALLATPREKAAWVAWYLAAAPGLSDDELAAAGRAVFDPDADPLPGLDPFAYAWSLLVAAAHQPARHGQASVLACSAAGCVSPLYAYFAAPARLEARKRLAAALLAAKDDALTELALLHVLGALADDRARDDLLVDLEPSGDTWAIALACAIVSRARSLRGPDLEPIWEARRDLRASTVRALAYVAVNAQRLAGDGTVANWALGIAVQDMRTLEHLAAKSHADEQELCTLVAREITPQSPLFDKAWLAGSCGR